MERSRSGTNRLIAMLFASVLLHLLLVPGLEALLVQPTQPALAPKRDRAVAILSPDQVRKMTRARPVASARPKVLPSPPPPKKKPKPKIKPKGQVVETTPTKDQTPPDDARFLAEHNSKVDKQQVAANKQSPTPKVIKSDRRLVSAGSDVKGHRDGRKSVAKKSATRTMRPRRDRSGDSDRRGETSTAKPKKSLSGVGKEHKSKLAQGDGRFRPSSEGAQAAQAKRSGGREVGGSVAPQEWRSLLPTLGPTDQERRVGSIDHVEDIEEGEQTFLNAREYRYAFFFNRVKRNVSQRWRASKAHRQHDPYGRIYGVRDRLTVVQVTLNPHGDLDDVIIAKDSGVAFLDEAALDAFRAAEPFPNPPDGLQDPDGRIRFRFGFFLEISSRGFRLFRSQ